MRRLAYLFPAFPVLHQTFTLGEVLGLKRKGYDLRLISLKRSDAELQQTEAEPLIDETDYCPRLLSSEMLSTLLRAVRTRPRDVARLVGAVVAAWRTRDPGDDDKRFAAPPTTLTRQERVLAVMHHNPHLYLLKSLILIPYAVWVAERLQQRGVGHLHAHWATYPTTVAMLVKQWAGIPYSFTAHAYDIYMISRMLPAKIDNAAFVVTCADANRRYLASLCAPESAERIHVNYHGADLARFSLATRTRTETFNIMSCGWLKEYKGFHLLLDAVAMLVGRGIDAKLQLAGDGPQRAYLEAKCRDLGITDRVTFHGYVGHDRLAEIYRSSDAFALPSIVMGGYGRQDVIPNVLAEAMAAGIPAVGSDIGGVSELIEDGVDGILIRERDVDALAAALERIWRDPELAERLAAAGREKVERIWDRDKNLEELGALFDDNVAEPQPGIAA